MGQERRWSRKGFGGGQRSLHLDGTNHCRRNWPFASQNLEKSCTHLPKLFFVVLVALGYVDVIAQCRFVHVVVTKPLTDLIRDTN